MKIFRIFLIFFAYFALYITNIYADISPEILENVRKGVITIDSRISISAYHDTGNFKGTGFIADKKAGLVITNAHVVTPASIGIYYTTFFNGKQSEAKLLYYDSWQDFAILKIDPKEFPEDSKNIAFAKEAPKLGQEVFIVGNNESQGFSFHSGYLSNLYDIAGSMPQHTYVVNLNVTGGSSGSPLINDKGEALGINYGGSKTYGLSLKGEYIIHALNAIRNGKIPARKHMGAVTSVYSLDKAVNHRNFPKKIMEDYIKQYPEYRNKIIRVEYSLNSSGSHNLLMPGDIIWQVNGKNLGANLYLLDSEMNKAADKIALKIYRNGEELNLQIPLYNILDYQVSKLVDFAGAIIFMADDFTAAKSGLPLGNVGFVNVKQGSGMSKVPTFVRYGDKISYRLSIDKLNNNKITDLDSVINLLPKITKEKFITIDFTNYQPYVENFNGTLQSGHNSMSSDITLDALDIKPRIMEFNPKKGIWDVYEAR